MPNFDVFNNSAFTATSMTAALDKLGHVPQLLSTLPGLIVPAPVRTDQIWIEERENAPALIVADERGAAPKRKSGETRKARGFKTVRLAQSSRITADTLQGIRAFGSESELQAVATEISRRQFIMQRDMDLSKENMYLSLVQGLAVDNGGNTLYSWATEFGQSIPAEIDFDLDNGSPAAGAVRKKCAQVTRSITKGLKGLGGNAVTVHAIAGDAFYDDLITHPEVEKTYQNWAAAADLRKGIAWTAFTYGDITWHNYRGTDDGTTTVVNTDKAKFFPVGAGIFQMAYAPAEPLEFVNTLGREVYSWLEHDPSTHKKWVDVEMFSYPLPVCTMPGALHQARRT